MDFEKTIRMIATMQQDYEELVVNKKLTKHAMCTICCPIKDELHLSDIQVLQIARKELSLFDIVKLFDEKKGT